MSERLEIMRELSQWVQKYGWRVHYNQKNSDIYPVFHANTNSKPDLLLQKGKYNVLVEVKDGENHQDLLNGVDQTWKYAGEYYSGRTVYRIYNIRQKIDAFVFATKYSRFGYLYQHESDLNYLEYEHLKDEFNMTEKPCSFTLTRFMWRQWQKGYVLKHYEELRRGKANKNIILPQKPKIGILIAKINANNKQVHDTPYLYLNSKYYSSMKYEEISCFE